MSLSVHFRKNIGTFCLQADFDTEKEVLALLGPSGSGKSLTLKCIAGIEKPDEGSITLSGRVLFDSSAKVNLPPQQRRVGYMFQSYALFPNMTVRKNVLAGMGRNPKPSLADPFLEQFRIADLADRFPHQLSEGQKQRTAMARIVAQAPDVILLDEPFSAMDTVLKWQLEQEMLHVLQEMNKPTVFVSHNIDEVWMLSHRVCSIKEGKTLETTSTGEYFEKLKTGTNAMMKGWRIIPAEDECLSGKEGSGNIP